MGKHLNLIGFVLGLVIGLIVFGGPSEAEREAEVRAELHRKAWLAFEREFDRAVYAAERSGCDPSLCEEVYSWGMRAAASRKRYFIAMERAGM